MELRASAQEPCMSPDPDDKEISDDDDDRNHKHRRRDDTRSQEDDITEQVFTKPYRRASKPSQNGPGSQSNETWKKYNYNPLEKDKFDKKRPGFTHFPRGPSDLNQKIRANQQFSVDPGAVRGRGWSQPYSVDPHSLFAGRGSNATRGPSWGPFGLVPGMPNGSLDMNMIHPLGLQGTFIPPINPSLNMGLARQRCRDFEEQGFCLRGDMCPMEHGVNRIVVEDVQSLSQFNLPVSLASTNLSIAPAGTGPSPAIITTTNTLSNSKTSHGKNIKHADSSSGDADFYDPDQPLWGNDSHTPAGPQPISQPNVSRKDSLLDPSPSGDDSDNEPFVTTMGSLSTTSKTQGTIKKRTEDFMHNEITTDSSLKMQGGNGRMVRKPSQKAERTLFVNGIPQQNNKRESLISHFKRFGEVIDIYIPLNSERAFVQFSKREEAEAALMAPDAVMGNRFIKLWWANRDNIPTHGSIVSPYKRKDDLRYTLQNDATAPVSVSGSENPKPVVANGIKVPPPLQKKLENLEVLKEELRKKQEMLDQKRNDFRRKLDKLEKQTTGVKGEVAPEQVAKKQKLGALDDSAKASTPCSSDGDTILPSRADDVAADSSKSFDPKSSKTTLASALQESPRLKSSVLPCARVDSHSPVVTSRFKLDNRPTAFNIVPPLPDGLADVSVLKEQFSQYGDISKVELDNIESNSDPGTPKPSARIYFTTRHAAEKAFLNAKNWKGHNLQFTWLNSNTYNKRNSDSSNQPVPVVEIPIPCTSGDVELEKRQLVKESGEGEESNLSKS
ncbi:hypothetical protein L1887_36734 [Cichorium endivia]|nr:hypothetical protein L1887_36734 [Cichorium endivia]